MKPAPVIGFMDELQRSITPHAVAGGPYFRSVLQEIAIISPPSADSTGATTRDPDFFTSGPLGASARQV
jgi:hypothetical protein